MADLIHIRAAGEAAAARNLATFIKYARTELGAFGADLDFDANTWPVLRRRAMSHRHGVLFSRLCAKPNATGPLMREPFLTFSKAYFRLLQEERPSISHGARLHALRALEMAAMEEARCTKVHLLRADTFAAACALLVRSFVTFTAYAAARELAHLADFLTRRGLVSVPLSWRSPLHRPNQERFGSEHELRRRTKLPSGDALTALGQAFHKAKEDRDRLATAVMALDLVGHGRISEVLTSPANCEVVIDELEGEQAVALRWYPGKGQSPRLKYALPAFRPIATRALQVARSLTEPARRIAAWYIKHPKKLYLPPKLEHLRAGTYVTLREVEAITGFMCGNGFVHDLPTRIRPDTQKEVLFTALEAKIVSMLPPDFPNFDGKADIDYSEALFVVQKGFFANPQSRRPMPCMIERVNPAHINTILGARLFKSCGSVFQRLGLRSEDGAPIKLTTHQVRHYLSDLAQRCRVSDLDLAAWAGRTPGQNIAYSHLSDAERVDHVRAALFGRSRWCGPQAETIKRLPVDRHEYVEGVVPTAHSTELGVCIHDFAMLPCPLHIDCMFCTEHVCIKGDAKRTEAVGRLLAENETLLRKARAAMDRKDYGSDRWVAHTQKTVERLRDLHALLTDRSLPDGSIVQLGNGRAPSRMDVAHERRAALDARFDARQPRLPRGPQ